MIGEGDVYVRETLDAIKSGNLQPRNIYKNTENHTFLGVKPAGYWEEYHLIGQSPKLFGPKSPLRILKGKNGELFFSPDHYKSVIPLN